MSKSIKSLVLLVSIFIGGCGEKIPECGDQKVLELTKNQFEPAYRKAILDLMTAPANTRHWVTLLDAAALHSANALNSNVFQIVALFKNNQAPFTFVRDVSNINLTFANPRVVEKKPDVGMAICEVNVLPKGIATAKLDLDKVYQLIVTQQLEKQNPPVDTSAMSNLEAIEGSGKENANVKVSSLTRPEMEKKVNEGFYHDYEHSLARAKMTDPTQRKIEIDKEKRTITESFDLSVGSKEVTLKFSAQKDSNGQLIVKIIDQ